MKIKQEITIKKSFDNTTIFTKDNHEEHDFEEFFELEGAYLDSLVEMFEEHACETDEFCVQYFIRVKRG